MNAVAMTKMISFLRSIERQKYSIVRIAAGLFAVYFFASYLALIDTFYMFRSKTEANTINDFIRELGPDTSIVILRAMLGGFLVSSSLFTIGFFTRINALLIWIGYTFFYNFFLCINQPHVTYFLYIVIAYFFLSAEPFLRSKGPRKFTHPEFLWVLTFVYMYQMSISGFSKALSPEWRAGDILRIMSAVRDPEPGIMLVGVLPDFILKLMTWSALTLECLSLFYIFFATTRIFIWVSHVIFYAGVILFIPHAKHVAFVMLVFNLLILDARIIPNSELTAR